MIPYSTKNDPVPIVCPEPFRLCYILMVRCNDTESKKQTTNYTEQMTRFILDLGPRTHLTTQHMADLNTLKLPERTKQPRLTTTHKIYYKQAPTYLQTNFNKTRDRAQHTRGSHLNFVVPNVKRGRK